MRKKRRPLCPPTLENKKAVRAAGHQTYAFIPDPHLQLKFENPQLDHARKPSRRNQQSLAGAGGSPGAERERQLIGPLSKRAPRQQAPGAMSLRFRLSGAKPVREFKHIVRCLAAIGESCFFGERRRRALLARSAAAAVTPRKPNSLSLSRARSPPTNKTHHPRQVPSCWSRRCPSG